MAIFTNVENKTVQGRIFHTATFIFLSLGGITMLYPFVLMISGSFRSEMDETDLDVVPSFFFEENVLYQKFLEFKYQQNVGELNRAHLHRDFVFHLVEPPEHVSAAAVEDFRAFFEQIDPPHHWQILAGVRGARTVPQNLRKLRQRLKKYFDGDIEAFAREVGTAVANWEQVGLPTPEWLSNRYDYDKNIVYSTYFGMLDEAPPAERQLVSLSGTFLEMIVYPRYGNIESYNQAFAVQLRKPLFTINDPSGAIASALRENIEARNADKEAEQADVAISHMPDELRQALTRKNITLPKENISIEASHDGGWRIERDYLLVETNGAINVYYSSLSLFRLPRTVPGPEQPHLREQWLDFVFEDLNATFVLLDGVEPSQYRRFLENAYDGNIDELNRVWESDYSTFTEIPLPSGEFLNGGVRQDYLDFLRETPPEHFRLTGPEYAWMDWLREKYADVDALNQTYDTAYTDFNEAWMPFSQLEITYTRENSGSLRWAFATRNYVNVIDAVIVEGRAFWNTIIFCSLSVIFALLVNPLAAYALSRFQLPGTYKILLLMMAVMAFPPMVTTIPVFIMMQNLGLMNTFAGLLLPTIANGYLIFLLKGFFDSLPRELYEAALMDGAGEFRMFFSITMSLSKPILAVVGLTAFNSAYTVFLFALIIAPAEDMWLLPVWLYQYRETVSMGGVFASVILASVPPILVFVFAQNIILRGIVVPVEK